MKLWLICPTDHDFAYDTFDAAVVAAETEAEARAIHPSGDSRDWESPAYCASWATSPEDVRCKLIGEAVAGTEAGVVLSSFNAG
jgi:hypothetical protein